MRRRYLWVVILVFLSLLPVAAQEQDFSNVEITATRVNGNVYLLSGDHMRGNIGASVGSDGVLIVDDQFAPLAEKIRAAFKGVSTGPLKFILNTHWHGDHTGGNRVFGPEAPIIAHTNVRKRLMTEQHILGQTVPPEPKEAWPVITFDASLSVHFNGEEIQVVHFPHGHTDGDSVIFFTGSNVVHLGDHFFVGKFPFVDLESGGTVEGYTKNVEAVMKQLPKDVKIIPGHGPLATVDDLKAYHHMLVETTKIVRQGITAKKSLDELKNAGLPEEWQSWAGEFMTADRWVETVYTSETSGMGKSSTSPQGK
jgi:glyoxylase-like metal-dependent hydrolase (beta-lactamase superfamily II)